MGLNGGRSSGRFKDVRWMTDVFISTQIVRSVMTEGRGQQQRRRGVGGRRRGCMAGFTTAETSVDTPSKKANKKETNHTATCQ